MSEHEHTEPQPDERTDAPAADEERPESEHEDGPAGGQELIHDA